MNFTHQSDVMLFPHSNDENFPFYWNRIRPYTTHQDAKIDPVFDQKRPVRRKRSRAFQPTASEHPKILTQAGFLRAKRIKQWMFYKRDEAAIKNMKRLILSKV